MSRLIKIKPYLKTNEQNVAIVMRLSVTGKLDSDHVVNEVLGISNTDGTFEFYPYAVSAEGNDPFGGSYSSLYVVDKSTIQTRNDVFQLYVEDGDTNIEVELKVRPILLIDGIFRAASRLIKYTFDYKMPLELTGDNNSYDFSDREWARDFHRDLDNGVYPLVYGLPVLFCPSLKDVDTDKDFVDVASKSGYYNVKSMHQLDDDDFNYVIGSPVLPTFDNGLITEHEYSLVETTLKFSSQDNNVNTILQNDFKISDDLCIVTGSDNTALLSMPKLWLPTTSVEDYSGIKEKCECSIEKDAIYIVVFHKIEYIGRYVYSGAWFNVTYDTSLGLDTDELDSVSTISGYPATIKVENSSTEHENTYEFMAVSKTDPNKRYIGGFQIPAKTEGETGKEIELQLPTNDEYDIYISRYVLSNEEYRYSKPKVHNIGFVDIPSDIVTYPHFISYYDEKITVAVNTNDIFNNPLINTDNPLTAELKIASPPLSTPIVDKTFTYEFDVGDINSVDIEVVLTDANSTKVGRTISVEDIQGLNYLDDVGVVSYDVIGAELIDFLDIDKESAYANSSSLVRWYVRLLGANTTTNTYQDHYIYTFPIEIPDGCTSFAIDYNVTLPMNTDADFKVTYGNRAYEVSAYSSVKGGGYMIPTKLDIKNATLNVTLYTADKSYTPVLHWVRPIFKYD